MTSIYLNIYDLTSMNSLLSCLGFGAYHTSIQIFDTEFSFGAHPYNYTGVIEQQVNSKNFLCFRKTIFLGESNLKLCEINKIIDDLKKKYKGNSYDVFKNNCNHFTNELSTKLVKKPIPSFVNRLPKYSSLFRCFCSEKLIYGDAIKHDGKNNGVTNKDFLKVNNENNEVILNILEKENQLNLSKNETNKSEVIIEQVNESNNELEEKKGRNFGKMSI